MPTFYDNVPLAECEFTLTRDEYTGAFWSVLFKSTAGKVDILLLALGALLIGMGAYYPLNGYSLAGDGLRVMLFSIIMGTGALLRVLVKWLFVYKKRAGEYFDTCKVKQAPKTAYIYRDSLVVKSEYAETVKYYSKMKLYAENKSAFVFLDLESGYTVIPKRALYDEQQKKVREIFGFAVKKAKK